jgi:hypothetical protein
MHRIHEFQRALNAYGGWIVSKTAAQILHYTAMRTVELRSLVWTGIDYETRLISVDPEVMKGQKAACRSNVRPGYRTIQVSAKNNRPV